MNNGTTKKIAPNCTRFRFISGIYYRDNKGERFVDFNNLNSTPKDNLL